MRLQRGATAGAAATSNSSSRGSIVLPVAASRSAPPFSHESRRRRSRPPSSYLPAALPQEVLAELAALSAGAEEQLQAALNAVAAAALEAEAAAGDPSLAAGDGRAALSAVSQAALDVGAAASGALPAAVDGILGPLLRFLAADVAGTVSFPPRPDSALRIGVRKTDLNFKRKKGDFSASVFFSFPLTLFSSSSTSTNSAPLLPPRRAALPSPRHPRLLPCRAPGRPGHQALDRGRARPQGPAGRGELRPGLRGDARRRQWRCRV